MAQCPARIFVGDDRWGGFVLNCGEPVHPSDEAHRVYMGACEPKGVLSWYGTYEPLDEPAG